MHDARNLSALSITLLAVLGLAACSSGPTEEEAQAALQAEAWASLQQAKADIDAKRQELRDLEERLAGGAMDEEAAGEGDAAAAGEGGDMAGEGGDMAGEAGEEALSPEEQLAALRQETDKMGEDFTAQLAEFINSQEIYEGEELTPIQRQAFDMKEDEDILVAQEYIDKAGNYQKAIDIYNTGLLADPTSEKLLAAKAAAEEQRYMTEERLAQVEKGMTEDEVRQLLGTPMRANVREYEERGVTAWFYPKAEPNTAAGVFYRQRRGELKVYEVDFDAVKAGDD